MKLSAALARRVAFEAVFAAVTLYAARPAFATMHLPLQDLPQHMAAISVLKRYAFSPDLRAYFELTLSRTQYLLVYLLGVVLSVPFSVEYASRLLVALTVVALPYGLRFALRRTGSDERLAVLAWPFAWNPQMMYGFLNYLLGIPIALVAIGLFADRAARARPRRQAVLALLALGAFYSHLIPYGLLGLGVLLQLDTSPLEDLARTVAEGRWLEFRARLVAVGRGAWRSVREVVFLAPSLVAVGVWILRSPARDPVIRAGGIGREIQLTWPVRESLPGVFRETVLNVAGKSGDQALIAWGFALLFALAASRAFNRMRRPAAPDTTDLPVVPARVAWLPLACAVLYVFSPEGYGWIWPIHTRFAVAAVLLLPLAMPRLEGDVAAWLLMGGMALVTVNLTRELTENFQRWDQSEMGDLDEALGHARPGRRLVALLPASRSGLTPSNVPTLHVAAYYQARGGDVSTFSFVDYPQSPFRFREDGPRPPRLPPRWEWETSLRVADPNLDYYDYVLARIGPADQAGRMPDVYTKVYGGTEWNLYERRR